MNFNYDLPCKGCPRAGCGSFHDQCEPYQTAKREQRKIIDRYRKDRETEAYFQQKIHESVVRGQYDRMRGRKKNNVNSR